MKNKLSFLLMIGFLFISVLQCKGQDKNKQIKENNNSQNDLNKVYNKDTIMLNNILREQLKYGRPQYDDFYIPYDYSEKDYTILLPYIQEILNNNGYKKISPEDFKEKIQKIFNRILDYNNSKNYIYINFFDKCSRQVIYEGSDMIDAFGIYVNKDFGFISDFYAIPEILDYQNIKGIKQYEQSLPTKQKTRDGDELLLYLWKDEENMPRQRHFNQQLLISRNKYLFNDDKGQFNWLIYNDEFFMESLVTTFGYTKDKKLLDWVMEKNRSNAQEFIDNYVFVRNCKGELEIREDILKYIEQTTTDKKDTQQYASALYFYKTEKSPNKWTKEEAYKILAYQSNTYDYLFMKYKNIDNIGWSLLGNMFYNYKREDYKKWDDIEYDFRVNKNYNLPHLEEALEYALNNFE